MERGGDRITENACHRVSFDGGSDPVDMDACNVFKPLLQIVQDYEFDLVSSSDEFMSQGAHVVSDVSQAFGWIFPTEQQNAH